MDASYIEKYNILQTFQSNDHQKVFIGTVKDRDHEIVIINILRDLGDLWKKDKEKLENALGNLLHLEIVEEGFVLVTTFKDAQPLEDYFNQTHVGIHKRMNILFAYLRDIVKYKELDYSLQSMLIDEAQILIDNHQPFLSELILIDKNLEMDTPFEGLVKKIAGVMKKILIAGSSLEDENKDMLQFIHKLENGEHTYKDIEDIYHAFRSYYLYQWAMGEQSTGSRKSLALREESSFRKKAQPRMGKSMLGKMALLVVALGLGTYGLSKYGLLEGRQENVLVEPVAYFERIETSTGWEFVNKSTGNNLKESIWEVLKNEEIIESTKAKDLMIASPEAGIYKVSLKVKGEKGQWSQPYEEEIILGNNVNDEYSEAEDLSDPLEEVERLDKLHLEYDTSQGISLDHDIYKTGNYGIRIEGSIDSPRKISFKNLSLNDQSFFSMWIMADAAEPIEIRLKGLQKNRIVFEKNIQHQPSGAYLWELLNIEDGIGSIDRLEMSLSAPSVLWLDDIEVDSFK
ncbi:hypothetical protein [Geosporobacter ferrireducens]|uniref:Uncharacterized protein n=1 Tax=Geosporobacter ferrireducens TaxID=1424294 RepID=A0A1D8GFT5_9FIRM|nr:hypothetical protein [Geosporobacter ferrireducens]AOT69777.1 hypothetical protein Gferi_09380 [Geosporobacter ferrireducens]